MTTELQLEVEDKLKALGAEHGLTYRLYVQRADWWIVDVREGSRWNALGGGTPQYILGFVDAMSTR